jgi:NAD(P)H-quinone oxidoreductase subunit 5
MVMLVLVSFIALVISRYSQNYMAGEAQLGRYYRNLNLTLAAVAVVVTSNHLLTLVAAWVAISVCFHQLLMFYHLRPRAALAAHKKFIFARLAELSLFAAAVLLFLEHGSWQIDQIVAAYAGAEALAWTSQWAIFFIAITAIIKCAQLPVHGWLIQVVEAPTPVSALLHAGIINLGGYVLIVFAPLLALSWAAKWLLLLVAGLTTLLAALIMMTRVSVKVRLAWSTTAQMGLMLVECALGLYELALLHLLAHSCYKAYAFLNAGSAVEQHMLRQLAPAASPSKTHWLLAVTAASALVAPLAFWLAPNGPLSPWLLLVFTFALILAERSGKLLQASFQTALGLVALLLVAYVLQKTGAALIIDGSLTSAMGSAADIWCSMLIVLLFTGYLMLRYAPQHPVGRRLWHALYGGLYLDEWSTRTTLAIWPTELPMRANPKQPPHPLLSREYLS